MRTALDPALAALAALIEPTLAPIVWATAQGLVARHARGEERLGSAWSEAQHKAAWQALGTPVHLRRGMLACRVDDAIVVRRAALIAPSLEALAQSGLASTLALRTLAAALQLGRNIVWTGPQAACDHAMTSLAAKGRHPGIWADPLQAPVPAGFVTVCDAQTVWRANIDRLVAPAAAPRSVLQMLGVQTGAQAWLSAGRLERALMRLELASGHAASEAAVQLLAAVDLLVVVEGDEAPHIAQIAELTMVESGYRPCLLFSTGHAIAPQALVPLQAPSFTASLASIGEQALAADLTHAAQPSGQTPASAPAAPPPASAPVRSHAPALKAHARPRPRPAPQPAPASDSQPGWELDRLLAAQPDEAQGIEPISGGFGEQGHAAEAAEAASLAAQFGLGPPPPPRARPSRPSDFSAVLAQSGGSEPNQLTTQDIVLGPEHAHAGHLGAPEDGTDDDEGPSHGGFTPGSL